jgi:hypothetical protein
MLKHGGKDAVMGLAGLIMLGGAWESPDVAAALSLLLRRVDDVASGFAKLRYEELTEKFGRKSAAGELATRDAFDDIGLSETTKDYKEFRLLADERDKKLISFMTQRLNEGRHPDTDSAFWAGYKEPRPPKVAFRDFSRRKPAPDSPWLLAFAVGGIGGVVLIGFLVRTLWLRLHGAR